MGLTSHTVQKDDLCSRNVPKQPGSKYCKDCAETARRKAINNIKAQRRYETRERKRAMYRAGKYQFEVPPVSTANWNEEDWIDYIDLNGWWTETP